MHKNKPFFSSLLLLTIFINLLFGMTSCGDNSDQQPLLEETKPETSTSANNQPPSGKGNVGNDDLNSLPDPLTDPFHAKINHYEDFNKKFFKDLEKSQVTIGDIEDVLNRGGLIDTRDPLGRTILNYALLNNDLVMVKYLLKKNASPQLLDKKGFSALDLVNQNITSSELANFYSQTKIFFLKYLGLHVDTQNAKVIPGYQFFSFFNRTPKSYQRDPFQFGKKQFRQEKIDLFLGVSSEEANENFTAQLVLLTPAEDAFFDLKSAQPSIMIVQEEVTLENLNGLKRAYFDYRFLDQSKNQTHRFLLVVKNSQEITVATQHIEVITKK